MFNLELTGFVGSSTFNSRNTLNLLNQFPDKEVNVLIDSQGGALAHGLSIADAFRTHGKVNAHLRGLCASAATIASIGANRITMAPDALYLVHQVSMEFFEWSNHNADSLQQYIDALNEQKEQLQTLDLSVAKSYASRCKKPVEDMIKLMKEAKWLSAEQALEWGFIDEIKTVSEKNTQGKRQLTKAQANAFLAAGLPLPPIPMEDLQETTSLFSEIKNFIKSILNMNTQNPANENPAPQDNQTKDPQNTSLPQDSTASQPQDAKNDDLDALKKENADLKAQLEALKKEPAADDNGIVKNGNKHPENTNDAYSEMINIAKNAAELYNSLP